MAKMSERPAGHAELKDVALEIFNRMSANVGVGLVQSATAHEAFRRSKVFLDTSDAVEMGELSIEAIPQDKYEEVEVPMQVQVSDGKWEKAIDPQTMRQITQKMPVDRYSYAPNLPEDHPINLRFKPHDGVRPSQRHRPQLSSN